jgi:hypothetical protein
MHVKEIYVIFIHLFDSGILLIIDLNKKKRGKKGIIFVNFTIKHRNRRYFVIKLHTWFCLSYFLKTNMKLYCIYQYFMSIKKHFYFPTMYVYCIYPAMSNSSKQLPNCLSRTETNAVLINFDCVLYDVLWVSKNIFFNTISVSRYSRPITVTRDLL